MNNEIIISFQEALLDITSKPITAWIYLPIDKNWKLNSNCAVLESEEVPPELEDIPNAGTPEFAKLNRLMQVLPVSTVQEIVTNTHAQKNNVTIEDLYHAFIYYYQHDGFIDW